MSDRYNSYPDDEPVIGATYPPSGGQGGAVYDEFDEEYDDYDDEYDEYDDEGSYDEYYEDTPAKQPLFYVFLGLAAVLGAAFIFLLFTIVANNGDDDDDTGSPVSSDPSVQFAINIDDPVNETRVEIREERDVLVTATATEDLLTFELLLDGRMIDRRSAGTPEGDRIYRATLRLRVESVGEYDITVRAISVSEASAISNPVRIVAVEAASGTPSNVIGRVLTQATLRSGPGDDFDDLGTVREGLEVPVYGRTRDNEWLFVGIRNGGWVRRTAIELFDALSIVPIREGSPTPRATVATQVPSPSTTPDATNTPEPSSLPDLVPTNAILIDGGSGLRVTVANLGLEGYSGPIEVSVGGLGAGTLTRAFGVDIPSGGSTTVDFDLSPPVTESRTAQIRVDPSNAIAEANEDNNGVSVGVSPPVEAPDISIASAGDSGDSVTVTVQNTGGPLQSSAVTVRVRLGNDATEQTQTLALANGQTAVFNVTRPAGTGTADIEVLVGGSLVASAQVTLN